VLQRVSLFDILYLDLLSEKGIELTTTCSELSCGEDNLVFRAAKLFFTKLDRPQGVKIHLVKRIPIAAGLGGGSSDAATTLLGLNVLFNKPFSLNDLLEMSERLGSDVPFFLYKKPAIARGRGEKILPLSFTLPFWYIIISPPVRVSTAWVYNRVALTKKEFQTKINKPEVIIKNLYNDLEKRVVEEFSEVGEAKLFLKKAGAKDISMTGSGSSVFAVFYKKQEALKVKKKLKLPQRWQSFLVKGL